MARKKQEIQLQQEIETQEEWEDVMGKEGLFVIDVYQDWCGPCAGMTGNFKKIKNEIGDQLLHFAKAKSDTVDSLEKYRGHCEPCFLFYAGGVLVSVVRGANAPLIMRTITEQLAHEHKVIDGQAERKEIKDLFISQLDSQEQLAPEDEEPEEEEAAAPGSSRKMISDKQMVFKGEIIGDVDTLEPRKQEGKKEVTVALIKPDAVQAGKVDEILADIKAAGIEVLKQEERTMTEDEVRNFYTHLQDEEYFSDLVSFMTSGPSYILVLTKGATGQNIINEFRDLIGPTSVEDAKEANPESLRAKHGSEKFMNALHGSSSDEQAHRELGFFFPDFVLPAVEGKPKLQRTLALIRPDAFKLHRDEILQRINEAGFKVALQKEMTLTKEMAEDFYKEHEGQEYFDELTTRMSSGPLMALGLAREEAVQGWRDMLGPKEVDKAKEESPDSLRAKFAVDDVMINQLHGSDSEESAKRELEYFFPMQQTMAVIKPNAIGTKDEIIEKVHDAGFRIAARKETTLSREIAEEFYSDHKDKEYFNDLVEHMTSGPTYFMVLSREDAVEGWRSIIGPTDPVKAKEENPESLRALYGESILQNAVHGSSNPEHAKQTMEKIFGELHFRSDGSLEEAEETQEESQAEETKPQQTEEGGEEKADEQTEQKEGDQTPEQPQEQTATGEQNDEQTNAQEQSEEQTITQEQAEDQGQILEGQTTDQTNEDEAEITKQDNSEEQGKILEGQTTSQTNEDEAEITKQDNSKENQGQVLEGQTTDQTNEDEAEITKQDNSAEFAGQEDKFYETDNEGEDEAEKEDTEEKPAEPEAAAPEAAEPEAAAEEAAKEEEKPAEEEKPSEETPPEEKPDETQQEAAVSRQVSDVQEVAPEAKQEETAQEEEKPKEETQKEEEPPKEEEKKEEEAETKEEESKEETAEQKAEETPKEETKEEESKEEEKPAEGEEEQKTAEPEQKPEGEEEKKEEAKPDEG